ncbi:MAG TPA: YtxH domain-containing protein [Anaerolineales bacterium]|nr:YtxH domain-containing protein [Anaerolineales bacterium]
MKSGFSTFLLGAALGAGVALLYAPQSGEQTRNLIRQRSLEARETAAVKLEEAQYRADVLSKQAKRTASELKEVGRQTLDEQKASLEKGARKAKETLQSEMYPDLPAPNNTPEM